VELIGHPLIKYSTGIKISLWWFSVIDEIETLTGTDRSRKYWNNLKKKLRKEGYWVINLDISVADHGQMLE
jgi:hypothetical protein